jgi:hypothetical protein
MLAYAERKRRGILLMVVRGHWVLQVSTVRVVRRIIHRLPRRYPQPMLEPVFPSARVTDMPAINAVRVAGHWPHGPLQTGRRDTFTAVL